MNLVEVTIKNYLIGIKMKLNVYTLCITIHVKIHLVVVVEFSLAMKYNEIKLCKKYNN